MKLLPAAIGVLVLLLPTGCDRPDTTAPSAPDEPPGDIGAPGAPPDGSSLAFTDASGQPVLTLACGAGELRISAPGLQPISSEDRLSIGADGEAFAFAADLAAAGPGVTASGAPDPDLLARLSRGEALYALYGQQALGPLAAASPGALQAFVSGCRQSN